MGKFPWRLTLGSDRNPPPNPQNQSPLDVVQGFMIAHVLMRDVKVGWVSLMKFEADF